MNCNTTHYRANSSSVPGDPTIGAKLYPDPTPATAPSRTSSRQPSRNGANSKSQSGRDARGSVTSSIFGLLTAFQLTGSGGVSPYTGPADAPDEPFFQIGHCLFALAAAVLGGASARIVFGTAPAPQAHASVAPGTILVPTERRGRQPDPRGYRRRGLTIWLALSCVNVVFALLAVFIPSTALAGMTFLLTCALLGIAVLGTIRETGPRRSLWLGVALFGWGYLLLAFNSNVIDNGWPYLKESEAPRLITTSELDRIRHQNPSLRRLPPALADGTAADNAPVLEALERRIPMRFARTELQVALDTIKEHTRSRDLPYGLPFYVDDSGLEEAEAAREMPVRFELDGVPLKISLRLLLNQIRLDYVLKSGVVFVTSRRETLTLAVYYDPVQRVVHCLIALIAASIGGSAARWAFEERTKTNDTTSGVADASRSGQA